MGRIHLAPLENKVWDGIIRVVHVLSMSESGCVQAVEMVERAGQRCGQKVSIDGRVLGSWNFDPASSPPLDGCAAVVVLSMDSANSDCFRRAVHGVVEQGAARDDFRVYLVLDGLTPAQFHEFAGVELTLFEYLRENIQLTNGLAIDEVESPLADYLARLRDVRSRAVWRRIGANTALSAGRVALAIQWACPLVLSCGWLLVRTGWATRWGVNIGMQREAISLSAGILHFWASTLPAYFVLRGFSAPSVAVRQSDWIMPKFMLCFLISLAALKMAMVAGAGNSWTVLGMAVGACVDGARRAGLQAQRIRHALEPRSANPEVAGLAANLGGVGPANIFRLPIWPIPSQSIVISYARASNWSYALASELHAALEQAGTPAFLDRIKIPVGSNWRRELQYEIGESNTFLCILDQLAVTRPWVAAEFFNALRGLALTGSPRVIVLENSALNLDAALPLYRRALSADTTEGTKMHVLRRIRVSSRTVEVLSHELKPTNFEPASVIPPTVGIILELVLRPITVLCAFAAMVGLLAWVGWIVEMWNDTPLLHWLHPTAASVLFLSAAYLAGCGFRLTVVSKFQIRHDSPGTLAVAQGCSAIGLLLFCGRWAHAFSPLIQGWALVALAFGWWRAGNFFRYVALGDPTVTRS